MSILQRINLENIVVIHFVLSVIGSLSGNHSYTYMNIFLLMVGLWASIHQDSALACHMFLRLNVLCIFLDIILFAVYGATIGHYGAVFIFGLVFAIINFLLRPFTSWRLYTIYQERGGTRTCNCNSVLTFLMGSGQGTDTMSAEDIEPPPPDRK